MKTILTNAIFAVFAAVMLLAPSAASAQTHISKVVDSLCDSSDDGVVLIEKRNPDTKQLWERRTIVEWKADPKSLETVRSAFEQDRANSVDFRRSNDWIKIEFGNNNATTTYIFHENEENGTWMLICTERFKQNAPRDDADDESLYLAPGCCPEVPDSCDDALCTGVVAEAPGMGSADVPAPAEVD